MASHSQHPKVFLAFRFHANFYHSYRGDTPDELGFGKDIRIIRKIIEVLDDFNADGVPARGTWDIENYFSLETIMPKHCPDIIESLQRRVAEGKDEVQVMSYNNGLISAHTASEFDDAVGRAITNDAGSGVRDIFGQFAPMVRPQEMMYTPMHLKLYPRHGIEYISLFYSAVPFNAFSNFVPPLPLEQRFNPLTLSLSRHRRDHDAGAGPQSRRHRRQHLAAVVAEATQAKTDRHGRAERPAPADRRGRRRRVLVRIPLARGQQAPGGGSRDSTD